MCEIIPTINYYFTLYHKTYSNQPEGKFLEILDGIRKLALSSFGIMNFVAFLFDPAFHNCIKGLINKDSADNVSDFS